MIDMVGDRWKNMFNKSITVGLQGRLYRAIFFIMVQVLQICTIIDTRLVTGVYNILKEKFGQLFDIKPFEQVKESIHITLLIIKVKLHDLVQ